MFIFKNSHTHHCKKSEVIALKTDTQTNKIAWTKQVIKLRFYKAEKVNNSYMDLIKFTSAK
jgi:hypothetical protein